LYGSPREQQTPADLDQQRGGGRGVEHASSREFAAAEMAKEGGGGPHEITIDIRDANGPAATLRLSNGLSHTVRGRCRRRVETGAG